jgi:hypothetical protein
MAVPSPLALTLIILALMAVASAPLAGAQVVDEPMNIVPALPPKACPKFTIAHIAVSSEGGPLIEALKLGIAANGRREACLG